MSGNWQKVPHSVESGGALLRVSVCERRGSIHAARKRKKRKVEVEGWLAEKAPATLCVFVIATW